MLSFDRLIQIFWIKANSQFAILLGHDYHRADPFGRLCDWCEDVALDQFLNCSLNACNWDFSWSMLNGVNLTI